MKDVFVELSPGFSEEQDRLRLQSLGLENSDSRSQDQYDAFSCHLVLKIKGRIAGMVRITEGPPFPFDQWALDPCPLPTEKNVVSMSRSVVSHKWRRFSLYKVLMVESLYLFAKGDRPMVVVSAIEPGSPLTRFLLEIGFKTVGDPIRFKDPPHGERMGQCIRAKPRESLNFLGRYRQSLKELLKTKDLNLISPF